MNQHQPLPAHAAETVTVPTADARPNQYLTNDEGVPMVCAYIPDHVHRGVYATTRLPAGLMGTVAACGQCQADHTRCTARLAEITAGARPDPDASARRVLTWADAMADREAYGIGVPRREPVSLAVADARALANRTTTPAQREELRAAVTAYLTHADGEPRALAPNHGTRPPMFTYDLLVLLDQQEPADDQGDGLTYPNGNRPPGCTEIDPCEACTQHMDAEAEELEASMGLGKATADREGRDPVGVYEVTVLRTEMISFRVRAATAQEAEECYLLDGEETASETVELRVESIQRQAPAVP